jgi:hypothetical protein
MESPPKRTNGYPYIIWIFAAWPSFALSFMLSVYISDRLLTNWVGNFIEVNGQVHVTGDYLFGYGLLPWFGLCMGLIQVWLLRGYLSRLGWWFLTTVLGWWLAFLGWSLSSSPVGDIALPASSWFGLVFGVSVGLLLGLAQWLLLRSQVREAGWWVLANVMGFGLAGVMLWNLSSIFQFLVALSLPSLLTALALWRFLRQLPDGRGAEGNAELSAA